MVCVCTSCTVMSLLIAALFPDPLKFGVRDVWIFLGSWCHLSSKGREMRGLCSRNLQFRRLALPSHPPNLPSPIPCTLHPWHLIGGVTGFLVLIHVGSVGRRKFTAPSTRH
ncbi:hypothetical protein FB451DRAFT_1282926, partial [Mycena latifolia]